MVLKWFSLEKIQILSSENYVAPYMPVMIVT
jgi:hypothetical protein